MPRNIRDTTLRCQNPVTLSPACHLMELGSVRYPIEAEANPPKQVMKLAAWPSRFVFCASPG
jgi:hypothetical protein